MELNEQSKALMFLMVAVHLKPKDAALWQQAGDLSVARNMDFQALYCLTKAVRVDPEDGVALFKLGKCCLGLGRDDRVSY